MRRLLAYGATTLLLAACADGLSPEDVAGRYALVTFNGDSLPISHTGTSDGVTVTLTLHRSLLTLVSDGTFSAEDTFERQDDSTSSTYTNTRLGTFTLAQPDTIRLTGNQGSTTSGTTSGTTLTIVEDGNTWRYARLR
jgi:hypothetical protein